MRIKIKITGIVQGVGFRPFIYRIAIANGLKGYVMNRGDAGVEILVEGPQHAIHTFLNDINEKKPPLARIHKLIKNELEGKKEYTEFTIQKSSKEKVLSGSIIPPDISICDECLAELRNRNDLRFNYFFITCTNCGPRFTIIKRLPYDRENNTMQEFPMCDFCQKEYLDPLDRRFHAQTIACPKRGPQVYLTASDGERLPYSDAVREAGRLLSEGAIVAIKGYGGFHVATSAVKDKPLLALRRSKHRVAKPFAVMSRSIKATKNFAKVTAAEKKLLTSYARPIVLLNKKESFNLSSLVSPNLHNVGVMLPYTGLHYMLFDHVDDKAFVMTSANPPNQPIVKDNGEALKLLGATVDYFLFHDRKIAHRCDDSVMRVHGTRTAFIRRSRGYAPAPVILRERAKRCSVGLGGELNNTSCVVLGNNAFVSQHIGDVENLETKAFLEQATNHLIRLTNSNVDVVVCDLHPRFTTTKLAKEFAEANSWQLIQVQHHYAHAAALMMEHSESEIIGIICDGYGYGVDGEAWGGEILLGTRRTASFKRLAHLEPQHLLGGDTATRYPLRIASAILSKKIDVTHWLLENAKYLPHGKTEAELLLAQLGKTSKTLLTTSCGRILDAVAAVLGVCYERTYEGEPAIKLESTAAKGKDVLEMEPTIKGEVLNTTNLLLEIFETRDKYSEADLAYSAHAYLAKGLTSLAISKALEKDVCKVGFSGGAASNSLLTSLMRKSVEAAGLKFIVNEAVPAGDGGVSFGQAAVGAFWRF